MDMSHNAVAGVDSTLLLLRIVLLLAGAAVAGIGLARPFSATAGRDAVVVAWVAAVVTAGADAISLLWFGTNPVFAIGQFLLALAVPVLLRWSSPPAYAGFALLVVLISEISLDHMGLEFLADTGYAIGVTAWLGLTVLPPQRLRAKPIALTVAVVLTLCGVLQAVLTEVNWATLVVALAPVVLTVLTFVLPPQRIYPVGTAFVVASFLIWVSLGALPTPADRPVPGVPLLSQADGARVLVAPQRPGRNLIHLTDSATVNGAAATPRPGATGTWAEVTLPPGKSTLTISRNGKQSTLAVDTGTGQARPIDAECAESALGGLIGGEREQLTSCPSDALSTEDAESLHKLVDFLDSKKIPAITLVGDGSARSQAAAAIIRTATVPVSTTEQANSALVVVSGWDTAAGELARAAKAQTERPTFVDGLYLAPWLLTAPLLKSVVSSTIPLRFDPREPRTLGYTMALSNAFPGDTGSIAGFDQWLTAQGQSLDPRVRLYAAAQVDAMPMDSPADGMEMAYPGQWIPNGTIVPISGPLT
jgi:hypothetical protein